MKFKVGDIVRFTKEMAGKWHGPKVEFDAKKRKIVELGKMPAPYRLEGLPENWFDGEELELVSDFEVGDIVKINKNATIDDFTKNHWGGCQYATLDFIRDYADSEKEFTVIETTPNGHLEFKESKGYFINKNIFELVKKKETVHEMTVKEIEEKLGIKGLKIVKD